MRFLYRKSYEEAKICKETELWRESRIENIRCCKEIDKAVSEMSVSNVIEVCEGKDKGFYFCDSVGFRPIDFDISQTNHKDMMRILIVEVGKAPYETEIIHSIHAMQSVVGGLIEPIYFEPDNDAVAWCNEEFLLYDYEPNRVIGGVLVHGTVYISGNTFTKDGWDSCSLTDGQISKYSEMFALSALNPEEEISQQNDGLIIIM